MTIAELEHRAATLEEKLALLSKKVETTAPTSVNNWIDQIDGSFQNDTVYRQAARLAREWRKSGNAQKARAK